MQESGDKFSSLFCFLERIQTQNYFLYICANLVSCKKRLIGNPVKIRSRPATVSFTQRFLKIISTVARWEGFQK